MKIALIQSQLVWGNVRENLENFERKMVDCAGCDVVLLPEMFASGCLMVKKSLEVAAEEKRNVAGQYRLVENRMKVWAAERKALVIGSTACEVDGKYYNRLIAAFPDGRLCFYDKRHCFRGGGENEHFVAGGRLLVLEFRGIRIATFICYDLRFPVWCRNTGKYDLAIFVANWPASRRKVWKTLLKARAIENQAFVAGVNCVGEDRDGVVYAGDSMVVNARGEIISVAEAGKEEIVAMELDLSDLSRFREKFPAWKDRDDFVLQDRTFNIK